VLLARINCSAKIRGSAALLPDGSFVVGTLGDTILIFGPDGSLKKRVMLDSWVFSSPVVGPGGRIYAGCDNGYFYSLTRDGDVAWIFELPGEMSSSPALLPGRIYVGCEDNALHALTPDQRELWRLPTGKRILFSSPAVDPEGNVYVGAEDGILYQARPDGTPGWTFDTGAEISTCSPVIARDGTIFIASGKNVFALDGSGRKKWAHRLHEEVMTNLALSPGEDRIYAAALDGVVITLSPAGKVLNKAKAAGRILSSPVVDSDGRVYLAGSDCLAVLDANGSLIYSLPIEAGPPFEADPIITPDGRLVLGRGDGHLYIFGDVK
jgi:outer membrane protein assembly factor BamB